MTQCSIHVDDCAHTTYCPTRPHWAAINRAVGAALAAVTLDDMISPFAFLPAAARRADTASETSAPDPR
jgi:DNA-binding IscR family transcriptional regulator